MFALSFVFSFFFLFPVSLLVVAVFFLISLLLSDNAALFFKLWSYVCLFFVVLLMMLFAVVPKCWFSIFLSRCFISLCEKLTSFTHGYSHFVCICFASWLVCVVFFLVLTFGYYKSPPSCCNSCSRVECFVLFLEVKIPEGVGQNEKSSPTFVNRNACVFVLICVSRERKFSCFISSCSKEVW